MPPLKQELATEIEYSLGSAFSVFIHIFVHLLPVAKNATPTQKDFEADSEKCRNTGIKQSYTTHKVYMAENVLTSTKLLEILFCRRLQHSMSYKSTLHSHNLNSFYGLFSN